MPTLTALGASQDELGDKGNRSLSAATKAKKYEKHRARPMAKLRTAVWMVLGWDQLHPGTLPPLALAAFPPPLFELWAV